jgi:ribosomal protein S18 acetylase RimI-like enzyme
MKVNHIGCFVSSPTRMKAIENITDFEKMTAQAWPAKESEILDGWFLRTNDGVTWRANTVLPFRELTKLTLEEALQYVTRFYQARGLSPAFKITSTCKPRDLDSILEHKGYVKESVTLVQITSLEDILSVDSSHEVQIEKKLNPVWNSIYCDIRGVDEFSLKTRLAIMERIPFPKGFALGFLDGNIAGIGLGVLQGEWLALFAIRTMDRYRRKGVAIAVNRALAKWAKEQGAKNAYLQVEASNTPALSLYSSLGFKTYYNYWYRILPIER